MLSKSIKLFFNNTSNVAHLYSNFQQPRSLICQLLQKFSKREGGLNFQERVQKQNSLRKLKEDESSKIFKDLDIKKNTPLQQQSKNNEKYLTVKEGKAENKEDKLKKDEKNSQDELEDNEEKEEVIWTPEQEERIMQQESNKRRKSYESHDSIQDLVEFDEDDISEQEKSQIEAKKLIERILAEDDNNDNSQIQQEQSEQFQYLSQLFKTREKRLAFELINFRSCDQVLVYYEKEKERIDSRAADNQEDFLSADEEVLFFYQVVNKNKYISDSKIFQQLLNHIFDRINQLSANFLQCFVWSLASYIGQFGGIQIPQITKKQLADHIQKHAKYFTDSQKVTLAFSTAQIFSDSQDSALSEPIIEILAEGASTFIQALSKEELVTMIMTFMSVQFSNPSIISQFVERIDQIKEEIDQDDLFKVASALGELNYQNTKQIHSIISDLVKREKGLSEAKMSCNTACNLIFTLSGCKDKNVDLLEKLLRIVHNKYKEMNITSYVNLWLGLGRFQIDAKKHEQTFSILLKILSAGHVFQMGDITCEELVRIMAATSSLKLNNKLLVGEFVKAAEVRMKSFSPDQLVILSRSCIIYVKQFEQFYLKIHNQCITKIHLFTYEQKVLLRQTFSRTRILFPDSPLIDTRL